jgi:glycosyltransferase involved in cell wall biosynthesis
MPSVSVIVCTYNRCESLRETLAALQGQVVHPETRLEIIIVDNNSSDQTRDVIQEAAKQTRWPLAYCFEGRQGKSHALNQGIRRAQGEFLLFTDDDVVPDDRWVQGLHDALMLHRADVAGGPIRPLWLGTAPWWLPRCPEEQMQ